MARCKPKLRFNFRTVFLTHEIGTIAQQLPLRDPADQFLAATAQVFGPYADHGGLQSASFGNNPDHEELIGGFLFAKQSHSFELPHPNSRR